MPKMGFIDEDDIFQMVNINSIKHAEVELGGRVTTVLLEPDLGMYVLESAASNGCRINHLATHLYCLTHLHIRKIFGPVLIFGQIDSCGNESADPQDMPQSAYDLIYGRVLEAILME